MNEEKPVVNGAQTSKEQLTFLVLLYAMALMHIQYPDPPDSSAPKLGLFIGTLIALLCLALSAFGYVAKGKWPQKRQAVELTLNLAALPAAGFLATHLITSFYSIATKASHLPVTLYGKVLWATGILAIGGIFFVFRYKRRFLYGVLEALVGAVVGCQYFDTLISKPISDPSLEPAVVATLTGGIYLVVRGFDNMQNGLNSDPWGKRAQKWIDTFIKIDNGERDTSK